MTEDLFTAVALAFPRALALLEERMRPALCRGDDGLCLARIEPLTEVELAAPVARVEHCRRCWSEEETHA